MICPKCGSAIPLYLKSCPNCNHEPIEKKDSIDSNLDSKLEGFKGVLAFVGLGMIVAPFLQAYNLHEELRATASFDLQMVLQYTSYKIVYGFATAFDVVLFAAICYLSKLFFCKKKLFPKFYVAVTIASIFIQLIFPILYFATAYLFISTEVNIGDFYEGAHLYFRQIILACIWIPYMLNSKRVKATFRG